jgi:hypothetical protein
MQTRKYSHIKYYKYYIASTLPVLQILTSYPMFITANTDTQQRSIRDCKVTFRSSFGICPSLHMHTLCFARSLLDVRARSYLFSLPLSSPSHAGRKGHRRVIYGCAEREGACAYQLLLLYDCTFYTVICPARQTQCAIQV